MLTLPGCSFAFLLMSWSLRCVSALLGLGALLSMFPRMFSISASNQSWNGSTRLLLNFELAPNHFCSCYFLVQMLLASFQLVQNRFGQVFFQMTAFASRSSADHLRFGSIIALIRHCHSTRWCPWPKVLAGWNSPLNTACYFHASALSAIFCSTLPLKFQDHLRSRMCAEVLRLPPRLAY